MSNLPRGNIQALFRQIAGGDIPAFEGLFHAYYDLLYSTALQYGKSAALAEDIVQQVFLTVWEKRESLVDVSQPEAWLFTIARNRVMDHFRRELSNRQYIRHIKEVFQQEEGTPADLLILRQRKELVERALATLTERRQEIYRMSREQGLSYEEIGLRLGIGRETVKDHISRSLAAIREFLEKHRHELFLLLLTQILR